MLMKRSFDRSVLVIMILFGLVFLSGIATADINDQIAQLDIETATLDDVIDIFGEPVEYVWGSQTYTRDNLPNVYLARYPNSFDVMMASGYISELRFSSSAAGAAGYIWTGGIQVGSSLNDVLAVVGQPTETVVGQPIANVDGVLYKDINGRVGYCYYSRPDQNVRFFFWNYAVSALYVTRSTTPPPPPVGSVEPFDNVRSKDLSGLDLSGRNGLIETLTFNEQTSWPEPAQMPEDRNVDELMIAAMNPGLGVRAIHQQGIVGAGINVAIIDQPIYQDHPEYDGKIAAYYDTGSDGEQSSMHGPAVTSLLVGENCGTAPGANVYYAAVPSWKQDAAYYADGLHWIIAQNETLSASEKIRVVSVSAAPSGPGSPFLHNNQMWDDAVALAEAAGIVILDCTSHHGIINPAWYDLNDMENVAKCTPGFPGYSPSTDPEGLCVPSSCRTTAQHYDYHGRDSYIYWGRGGLSWSIPYCAGVMALGWQIRPELTGEQMVELVFQAAYVNNDGAKIIDPSVFIDLLDGNTQTLLEVAIDIKPGSCLNPLNVKSHGVLSVAILGSEEFDVSSVVETSVELAGVSAIRHSFEDVATSASEVADCNCIETGPDGFTDLTLKFKTQEIVEAIGEVDRDDVLTLNLTGVLFDETPVVGADCILVRGAHKPPNKADINKDGVVDGTDFLFFAENWLQSTIVKE